jgi:hypothetical protein
MEYTYNINRVQYIMLRTYEDELAQQKVQKEPRLYSFEAKHDQNGTKKENKRFS